MNNNFEQELRSRFEGFEAPLSDGLFEAIQSQRKKKRVAIWWWSGLGGAAAILAISVLMLGRDMSPEHQDSPVLAPVERMQDNATEQVVLESAPAEPNLSQENIPVANTGAVHGTVNAGNGIPQPAYQSPVATTTTEPVHMDQAANEQGSMEPEAQQALPEQLEEGFETELLVTDAPEQDETMLPEESEEAEQPKGDEIRNNKRRPSRWTLDVQAGPGYASRFYTGEEAAMQWRRSVETPSLSYHLAIGVAYKLRPKWRLQTGIQYYLRNEIMSFTHLQNGVMVEEGGRNHYTRLAIPIAVEHDLYVRNGYSFHLMGGLHYGIQQAQSGIARVGEHETVILQEQEVDQHGSVAALVGLGLNFQLNRRTQLMIRPQLSYDLNDTHTGTLGLNRREFAVHTNLGVRYAW